MDTPACVYRRDFTVKVAKEFATFGLGICLITESSGLNAAPLDDCFIFWGIFFDGNALLWDFRVLCWHKGLWRVEG